MKNFACFNELSVRPLCTSEASVDQRIRNFLKMLKEVRNHTHITKVRLEGEMTTVMLTETMSLMDYLNSHTTNPTIRAMLGIFIHPQVDMDDDISLQRYLDTRTDLKYDDGSIRQADGFNAAYCQNTFCVGMESCAMWQKDFFDLLVSSNGKSNNINWLCVSSPNAFSEEPVFVNRKIAIDEWLQERNIELVESSLSPDQKPMDVEGDHGQHLLKEHAKMLNRHPYVEGVLTSLSFKPRSREYILSIKDDGIVDVVLWWEDAGYSMRVKTTGRNIVETKEIAAILRDRFGRGK